jgi:hypothetical protein
VSAFAVAFTVASIQHCVTTFRLERRVVWRAPILFATCKFVVSRYIPILGSILALVPLGGFQGFRLPKACVYIEATLKDGTNFVFGWIYCSVIVGTIVSLILNNTLAVWHAIVL